MFVGFKRDLRPVNGIEIACRIGGHGPGLLLWHGHPQTHAMWHKIAGRLAEHFTVVAADLRGYGDSFRPEADAQHHNYSKRQMARDGYELMLSLGFERFSVLAHDRGARVAHRLAMDFPDVVKRMVLLDIAPTLAMYGQTNEAFARAYWHWFFLIRPAPLPETLIEADPEGFLRSVMGTRHAGMAPFTEAAFTEYLRCLRRPCSARGICEDYRASASIDLEHDREDRAAGRMLEMPMQVLWGAEGTVGKLFKPLEEWHKVAREVSGHALSGGHYLAEEVPDEVLAHALPFLRHEV